MIEVNFPNIVTIALCGMLGYALLAGVPKLRGLIAGAPAAATA